MEDRTDEAMKLISEPLREALKEVGITNTLIAEQLKSLLTGDTITGKLGALQLLAKMSGWMAPEKFHVTTDEIVIEGENELNDI